MYVGAKRRYINTLPFLFLSFPSYTCSPSCLFPWLSVFSAAVALRRFTAIGSWSVSVVYSPDVRYHCIAPYHQHINDYGHLYADDTQAHISVSVGETQQAAVRLAECVEHLDRWMGQNRSKLNAERLSRFALEFGSN